MTRKDLGWMAGVAAVAALTALPLGLTWGLQQWLAAGTAVGLCVPAGCGTITITRRLAVSHPLGSAMGMMIGTLGRLIVGFGGGAAVFFVTGAFDGFRVGYWLWLLAIYLAVLVVETFLLANPIRVEQVAPLKKG